MPLATAYVAVASSGIGNTVGCRPKQAAWATWSCCQCGPEPFGSGVISATRWVKLHHCLCREDLPVAGSGYTRFPLFNLDRNMNKAELIAAVAASTDLPKTTASTVLDAFLATITSSLQRGESVALVGFGTFEVKQRAAREGRNPQS